MKKKLITALATKFEGVDAKVLDRIAENILKNKTVETDEDVNSAVEEETFADILKSYGDARATEATKTAVTNYEKKHGLKDGKPVTGEGDGSGDGSGNGGDGGKGGRGSNSKDDERFAELKELIAGMGKKMDGISAEVTAFKAGRVKETRQAQLAEILKPLTETQRKAYSRLAVDSYSEEDFAKLLDEVKGEVVDLSKEVRSGQNSFGIPLGGGNDHGNGGGGEKEATDAEVQAVIEGFTI